MPATTGIFSRTNPCVSPPAPQKRSTQAEEFTSKPLICHTAEARHTMDVRSKESDPYEKYIKDVIEVPTVIGSLSSQACGAWTHRAVLKNRQASTVQEIRGHRVDTEWTQSDFQQFLHSQGRCHFCKRRKSGAAVNEGAGRL